MNEFFGTVLETSYSDDDGRDWSTPQSVGADRFAPLTSSLAVGPTGIVYVVALDPFEGKLWAARSLDGGAHFGGVHAIATTAPRYSHKCEESEFPIPAQAQRCVSANPILNVFERGPHRGEVVVTYETEEPNGTQGVYADGFTEQLKRVFRSRVNPPDAKPRISSCLSRRSIL